MNKTLRARTLGLGLAAAVLLGGCAVPVPEFTPPPAESQVFPVLDESRLDRVLASVNDTLNEADKAKDRKELGPRVSGRAAQMRGWEYSLAKATKKAEMDNPYTPQRLSTDPAVTVVAATEGWPRQVMVITDPPKDGNIPLLLALSQEDPRAEYSLRGWVRLLPGVTTPQMHAPEHGSEQLPEDVDDLRLSPEATIKAYAAVLNEGEDAKDFKKFTKDDYRGLIADELKGLKDSLAVAGKVTQKTKKAGEVLSIRTFDGGAIVFGGLKTDQVYEKTVTGAKMKVGDLVAAKNGGEADVNPKLTATYQHMVAFYVPAKDSDEKISIIGAERVLSAVSEPEED